VAEGLESAVGAAGADAPAAPTAPQADELPSSRTWSLRAAYGLGLAVQAFIWFLIFFALAVAIGVGGHLTEFRYVGF